MTSVSAHKYLKDQMELNNKMLKKLDYDLKVYDKQLVLLKIRTSTLQLQMTAMQIMYKVIMELRQIIVILHPHLRRN